MVRFGAMPVGSDSLELLILLLVALLALRSQAPAGDRPLARQGMREFKDSVTGYDRDDERPRRFRPQRRPTAAPAPSRENETVRLARL